MTPKLKALSLIESMSFSKSRQMNYANGEMVDMPQNLHAKQCALVAVDEIMEFMRMDDEYTETASNANSKWVHYWIEVKKEIEKL
jgi:hypothetical protein